MEVKGYKSRLIDKKIELYLEVFKAILIEGPKGCGKTWTGKRNSNSEFLLDDASNNFNNRRLAILNLKLVLDGETPRLIDEYQEVPALFDAIRSKVDESNLKGQFIITGSTVVDKSKFIHSGTGRIVRIKMRTMSLYEANLSDGKVSLLDICNNSIKEKIVKEVSLEDLIDYILIGGWPSSLYLDSSKGRIAIKEYINSVLNSDIYKVDNVKRDKHKIELLLKSLARNESTLASNVTLKNDIKDKDYDDISLDTLKDYLNLLSDLYLIENIPPYSMKLRSSLRVKQSEKRHFVDPSLPCAILNLTKEKLLNNLDFLGFLFESLVVRDLLTYITSIDAKLYHYHDYKDNEIDLVIETNDGSWIGIEVKLGSSQVDEASKNLIRINNLIIKNGGKGAKALCVIVGLSNAIYKRSDGVIVVPITSLKD